MSDGSHLSIGEVLALLLEEFPDITISKIRFLESQGLIDPERTPSGYRKFFDADVELLRVILREQRENYLPLRVIKDRIDSGELDPSGEHPTPEGLDDGGGHTAEPAPEEEEAMATIAGDEPDPDRGDASPFEPARNGTGGEPPPQPDIEVVAADDPAPDAASAVDADAVAADVVDAAAAVDADAVAAAVRAAGEGDRPRVRSGRTPRPAAQLLPGVTLSSGELAAMVGATGDEVAQLEEYGIISGRDSLGERVYDDDAVATTKVAVEFLRLGVDARHLRGWKTSADRETSVYEQLILPLLRQRNPEGRRAAHDQLEHMSELGGRLRAALVRAGLRGHLGG